MGFFRSRSDVPMTCVHGRHPNGRCLSQTAALLGGLILLALTLLSIEGTKGVASFAFNFSSIALTGYYLLRKVAGRNRFTPPVAAVISAALGFQVSVSIYGIARSFPWFQSEFFLFAMLVLSALGVAELLKKQGVSERTAHRLRAFDSRAIMAGVLTMAVLGSAFYFSGRFYGSDLLFFGPMGRDHAYHLALIARLQHSIPPDNFVISGYPLPAYHFFGDLGLHLLSSGLFLDQQILDVYYRYFPSALYFAIGFLAYSVCVSLFASRVAAIIGVIVVVFGADLAWFPSLLQTLSSPGLEMARQSLFTPWVGWNAFGTLYPLVHRPAYYFSLLFFLAGTLILLRTDRSSRCLALAGMMWGLIAGFNYTFTAVLGVTVLLSACIAAMSHGRRHFAELLTIAFFVLLGSLPANFFVLQSMDLGSSGPRFFSFSPGEFAMTRYESLLGKLRLTSHSSILLGSTLFLLVFSYGLKLAGLPLAARVKSFRLSQHRQVAVIAAGILLLSLAIGMLFRFEGVGGLSNNIIFLQPTGWLLGLFAIWPLTKKILKHTTTRAFKLLIAVLLVFGPLQALIAFNLSYKIRIDGKQYGFMQAIRQRSDPLDVIAYSPQVIRGESVLGLASDANNFFVGAFTGLRAFFTVPGYSLEYARGERGAADYARRVQIFENFSKPELRDESALVLRNQGVRWVVQQPEGEVRIGSERGWQIYELPDKSQLDAHR